MSEYKRASSPEELEALLAIAPTNRELLVEALFTFKDERRRYYTRLTASLYPDEFAVWGVNGTEYFRDPKYRQEIEHILFAAYERGVRSADSLMTLAQVVCHDAVPLRRTTPRAVASWRRYFKLDETVAPPRLDVERCRRALRYVDEALEQARALGTMCRAAKRTLEKALGRQPTAPRKAKRKPRRRSPSRSGQS